MKEVIKNELGSSDWYIAEYDSQLDYGIDRIKSLLNFGSIFFKRQVLYDSHILTNKNLKDILYQEPRFLKEEILLPVLRKEVLGEKVKSFEDLYHQWKNYPPQGVIHDDAYPQFLDRVTNVALRSDSISRQYFDVLKKGLQFEKLTDAMGLSAIIDPFMKRVMELERTAPWRSDIYEVIDRLKLYRAASEEFSEYQQKLKLIADYAYAENMANYLEIGYQYPPKIREIILRWKLPQDSKVHIEQLLQEKSIIFEQEVSPNPFDVETLARLDYSTIAEIRKSYAAKSLWKGWEEGLDIREFQAVLQAYIDTCKQVIFEQVTGIKAKRAKLRMLKVATEGSSHIALFLHHVPTDLSSALTELSVPLILFGIDKLLDKHDEKTMFENRRRQRMSLLEKS